MSRVGPPLWTAAGEHGPNGSTGLSSAGLVPIGELMEPVPLRARATCTSCLSKLPPRTEVYWDESAQAATCLTCMNLIQQEAAATESIEVHSELDPEPDPAAEGPAEAESRLELPKSRPELEVVFGTEPQIELETQLDPEPAADSVGAEIPWPFPAPPPIVSHGLTIRGGASPADSGQDEVAPDTELDRGDMGEGRVGQTIEAARIHGLEVLHGVDIASGVRPIDHLVIAVNGLWVIRAQDALTGRLERRDLGDWFTADPRLYVKDEDQTQLIDETRRQVEAVRARLGPTSFGDVVVRGVVCYGTAPAGWVSDPFDIANVRVTWRNLLVEPMLDPVMIDEDARLRLTAMLAADRRRAKIA